MDEIIQQAEPFLVAVVFGIFGAIIRIAIDYSQDNITDSPTEFNGWKSIFNLFFKTAIIGSIAGITVWVVNLTSADTPGLAVVATIAGFGGLQATLLTLNLKHEAERIREEAANHLRIEKIENDIAEIKHQLQDRS